MNPSIARVAARYLEARSQWNEFLDFFRTDDEVRESVFADEIALTKQFFEVELPAIVKRPDVKRFLESYKQSENLSKEMNHSLRTHFVRDIGGATRLTGQALIRKFSPEARRDPKAPTGIADYLTRLEKLGHVAAANHAGIPAYLKALGVPMMAFASERTLSIKRVVTVTLPKRDVPLLKTYCGEMGWTVK